MVGSVLGDDLVFDHSAGRIAGGVAHLVGEIWGCLKGGVVPRNEEGLF